MVLTWVEAWKGGRGEIYWLNVMDVGKETILGRYRGR